MSYVAALDGLRALSVIAVVLYHADVAWMPGGFLGVEVFFVLSGFLIASLLGAEHARDGRVDFTSFLARRLRRLLPATLALLIGVVPIVLWLARDRSHLLGREAAAVLAHALNWQLIWSGESYFERMGRPSLLRHLWSLAVEEQLYLFFPLLFAFVLSRISPRARAALVLIIAACSAAWMAALYDPDGDPSRVYFGTDTRAAGFLIGAALALGRAPLAAATSRHASRVARGLFGALGSCALAAVLAAFAFVNEVDPRVYRGGFAGLAAVTALLIAVLARDPSSVLARALAWPPLRFLGVRSYSLYLWHWPVLMVTRPSLDLPLNEHAALALRIALSLLLADLSYRFVEEPARRGGLERALQRWAQRDRSAGWRALALAPASVAALACVPVLAITAASALARQAAPTVSRPSAVIARDRRAPARVALPAALDAAAVRTAPPLDTVPAEFLRLQKRPARVLAFGDSVMRGAARALYERGVRVEVDAVVGRQVSESLELLAERAAMGDIPRVVVVHLGNNGTFRDYQLTRMMRVLSAAKTVVFLNNRVMRRWEATNNEALRAGIAAEPRALLVDWRATAEGHADWFTKDGIHLLPPGQEAYAAMIHAMYRVSDAPSARAAGLTPQRWLHYSERASASHLN